MMSDWLLTPTAQLRAPIPHTPSPINRNIYLYSRFQSVAVSKHLQIYGLFLTVSVYNLREHYATNNIMFSKSIPSQIEKCGSTRKKKKIYSFFFFFHQPVFLKRYLLKYSRGQYSIILQFTLFLPLNLQN